MKKLIVLLLLTGTLFRLQAQPGFLKIYQPNPNAANDFMDMIVDNDTIVAIMAMKDTVTTNWSINLTKIDTFGNVLESQLLSSTEGEYLTSDANNIISTKDGGYAFGAAYFTPTEKFVFLAKFNHHLEPEYIKYFPLDTLTMSYMSASNLIELDNGDILMCIRYLPIDAYNAHYAVQLFRLNGVGEIKWKKTYQIPDVALLLDDILLIDDNTILFSCAKFHLPTVGPVAIEWSHSYAFKIDSLGNKIWEWESVHDDTMTEIVRTADGGYMHITMGVIPAEFSKYRLGIRKVDSLFNEEWVRYVPVDTVLMNYLFWYKTIDQTPDGNYVVSGDYGQPANKMPIIQTKITEDGEVLWERFYGASYDGAFARSHKVRGSGVLSSGSAVIAGSVWIKKPNGFSQKGFLMKTTSNGCLYNDDECWAPLGDEVVEEPEGLLVYPNPASDYITFSRKGQAWQSKSELIILDAMGRVIRQVFPQGGDVTVQTEGFSSGLYFYRFLVDGVGVDSGRILVE